MNIFRLAISVCTATASRVNTTLTSANTDPLHARWLSEDPAGYADGLNLYNAYMGVNGVDPLGLEDRTARAYFNSMGHWNPRTPTVNEMDQFAQEAGAIPGAVVDRIAGTNISDFDDELDQKATAICVASLEYGDGPEGIGFG